MSYLELLGERGTTQSPLGDCCKQDLLKCAVPGVEHTPLKEGRRWGSWPGASRPQHMVYEPGLEATLRGRENRHAVLGSDGPGMRS